MARLKDGGDRRSENFSSPNGELKDSLTLSKVSEIIGASERQISRAIPLRARVGQQEGPESTRDHS
jgi:hypothetical protein